MVFQEKPLLRLGPHVSNPRKKCILYGNMVYYWKYIEKVDYYRQRMINKIDYMNFGVQSIREGLLI